MSEVALWPTLAKTSVVSTDYIPVTGKKKLQVSTLFPSFATAGVGGQSLYTSITNKNQLNFKGLLSLHTALTVATASSNLVLDIVEGNIDLDLCDNSTSLFLKTVSLTANVTGVLPLANGGTGLSSITKGSVLYASAINTLAASTPLNTNGQLLIGHTGNGYPSVSTLTAGANITITNGAGAITIAANITTLLATLDCSTFGINLNYGAGASWLSGDGTAEGVTVDASGRVFVGDSVPTLPTLAAQLTMGGNATVAVQIGNNNNYKDHEIKATNATGASAGLNLSILGANATVGNNNGGNMTVKAGDAAGTGTSGDLILAGGSDGATATAGKVKLRYYTGNVATDALVVDGGKVKLPAGPLVDSQAAQTLTGAGAVSIITSRTHFTDTGANALTLADGTDGQHKYIVQIGTSGGAGTLTPTNLGGYTTITFNAIGESVHLLFTNGEWYIVGIIGATPA